MNASDCRISIDDGNTWIDCPNGVIPGIVLNPGDTIRVVFNSTLNAAGWTFEQSWHEDLPTNWLELMVDDEISDEG